MEFHKNWPAICALKNSILMHLVATCWDSKILTGLQLGFPELFTRDESIPVKLPLSVLQDSAEKGSRESCPDTEEYRRVDREFWLTVGDTAKMLPIVYTWQSRACGSYDSVPVPTEVRDQLVGQTALASTMLVHYRGDKFRIVYLYVEGSDLTEILGKPITREVADSIECLTLVPASCIDVEK